MHYIEAGKEDGAQLMTGGSGRKATMFKRGYWIEPTVFADVNMACASRRRKCSARCCRC